MADKIGALWVSQLISERAWNSYYQYLSYSHLGLMGEGKFKKVKMGFLVANPIIDGVPRFKAGESPDGCELLTQDEQLRLDKIRRSSLHYPFVTVDL